MSIRRWKVKLDTDFIEDEGEFELSVVVEGSHGDSSWGWPGEDKIMLLEGHLNDDYSMKTIKLVKKYAKLLCNELNAKEK